MFFFKQKTAFEMRISDWSSDVCSSDLCPRWKPSIRAFARTVDADRLNFRLTSFLMNALVDKADPRDRQFALWCSGLKRFPDDPNARRFLARADIRRAAARRSEENTSELQSLMRISYAGFCLKTKTRRY